MQRKQRHSQEGDVKMEAEIGEMHLQAVEGRGLQAPTELGEPRGLGQILPLELRRNQTAITLIADS